MLRKQHPEGAKARLVPESISPPWGRVLQWDPRKNEANLAKHGVSFFDAQRAFWDPNRIIAQDLEHSRNETRYYCFGKIDGAIVTVRFTYRNQTIRIFGAGYWRQGRKIYEKAQS